MEPMKIEWASRFAIHDTKDEENRLSKDLPIVQLSAIDAILGEAVKLAERVVLSDGTCSCTPEYALTRPCAYCLATAFLASPTVTGWETRQKMKRDIQDKQEEHNG